MDRFEWTDGALYQGENLVTQQTGVRLYDGDAKSKFDSGTLSVTTHRLIWRDRRDPTCKISFPLSLVVFIEDEPSGFNKSAKITAHLNAPDTSKPAGPVRSSPYQYIKLSFRDAGQREFLRSFSEMLKQKRWEQQAEAPKSITPQGRHRAGIVGIERNIQQKQKATDRNISVAFEDLSKLIEKAKEMVRLSKTIANKIKDKQGDITDDETVRFKSYLLSMGIPDPVTRDTHGSGTKYFVELAKQLSSVLEKPLQEMGGMMTLTDMYCRLNRARGMELLSPEDLLNACRLLDNLKLPVRFREFESGVMVVQLQSHSEEKWIAQTSSTVDEKGHITADELAQLLGVSVILAKERLLCTEKAGKLCRDETVEGLRFYPNLFRTKV